MTRENAQFFTTNDFYENRVVDVLQYNDMILMYRKFKIEGNMMINKKVVLFLLGGIVADAASVEAMNIRKAGVEDYRRGIENLLALKKGMSAENAVKGLTDGQLSTILVALTVTDKTLRIQGQKFVLEYCPGLISEFKIGLLGYARTYDREHPRDQK
jgi:hypothetical protein